MPNQIRFMQFYVTDGAFKSKCWYSNGKLIDGSQPVTIYARDYGHSLGHIFGSVEGVKYKNDTDIMTDYFDKGCVRIPVGHPLYQAALERCQANEKKRAEAYDARLAKIKAQQEASRAAVRKFSMQALR